MASHMRCPGEDESLDVAAERLGARGCMAQAAQPGNFWHGTAAIAPRSPLKPALLPADGFAAIVSV